jgi:membrane protein YdbS with pleckstrin-like domain
MSTLAALLGPDEQVILQTRQHWWVLFAVSTKQLLGLVVFAVAIWYARGASWLDNTAGTWVVRVLWVIFAAFVVVLLWKVLTWLVQKFTITTTKVVYQHGVVTRDVISVPLVKLDEVTLVQPLLGRIFGFGRLDVENAAGGRAPLAGLEYLPKPVTIYREITERARHQRLLEGGGRRDEDGDGLVDREPAVAAPTAAPPAVTPAAAPAPAPASTPEPHVVSERPDPTSPAADA